MLLKNGYFLKVSGAILVPLMLWFIINLISIYDQRLCNDVCKFFFKIQSSKFLFSVFLYLHIFFQL